MAAQGQVHPRERRGDGGTRKELDGDSRVDSGMHQLHGVGSPR